MSAETDDALIEVEVARHGGPEARGVDWCAVFESMRTAMGPNASRSQCVATPAWFATPLVRIALAPLLAVHRPGGSAAPRVLDLAVGCGRLLHAAALCIADALQSDDAWPMSRIVSECLYGVDRDPLAVVAARVALSLLCHARGVAERQPVPVPPTGGPTDGTASVGDERPMCRFRHRIRHRSVRRRRWQSAVEQFRGEQ